MSSWFVNNQVGGRQIIYETFTYSILRGSGHMGAFFQPERSYILVSNFVNNGIIPVNSTFVSNILVSSSNFSKHISLVFIFFVTAIFITKLF
jgi:hypothetical protein